MDRWSQIPYKHASSRARDSKYSNRKQIRRDNRTKSYCQHNEPTLSVHKYKDILRNVWQRYKVRRN